MMQSLRKGASGLVVKLFIGLLVISFGVWGIADFLTGTTQQTIASVGGVQITPEDYQRAYERQIANYSAQIGRQITTEEARAAGLPQQILDNLISRAALTERARALGIGISEDGIRRDITSDEVFQGSGGAFSRERFDQLLRSNGLTEAAYVEDLKGELLRQQLLTVFAEGAIVPDILLRSANQFQNEERIVSYFAVDAEDAGAIETPSEETLKSFYEQRKQQFSAPEYRKVFVVLATPEKLKQNIELSEEALKQAYQANIDKYRTPERRKIEQISYPSKQEAQAAYAAIAAGKEFLEAAREAGFTQSDIDLGLVSQTGLADEKIAKAAFSLKEGEVSQPVEGALTTALVRVVEIIPGEEKSFEAVRDDVAKDLEKTRVSQALSKVTNAFEEDRITGMPLTEAAKKHGLEVKEVTVDQQGRAPDGKPVDAAGWAPALTKAIFESDVAVENDPVRLEGGAYAWFEVLEVIPPRQKPFEEVKEQAAAAWRAEQIRAKLIEQAQTLQKRVEQGEPIAEVAKTVNAEVKETKPLKRNAVEPGFPLSAVAQAFGMKKGAAAEAGGTGLSRIVFQVKDVIAAKPLEPLAEASLRQQLAQAVTTDILSQYIAAVRSDLGAQINTQEFSSVTGLSGTAN